jgi:hypothetical protein
VEDVPGDDAGDPCAEPPAAPALLGPPQGALTGSPHGMLGPSPTQPTLAWSVREDECGGEVTFDVEVDDSCAVEGFAACAFESPEARVTGWTHTSWEVPTGLPISAEPPVGRRYFWRVRACRTATCSAWSTVRYLDVGRVAGDYNGDGYSDVAVGAPGFDNPGTPQPGDGRVFLYLGGDPPTTTGARSLTTGAAGLPGERLGRSVAWAGDVNGDGFADLAVGAPGSGTGRTGHVYIFQGGAAAPTAPAIRFAGTSLDDGFGRLVVPVGDVDGDGFADVLVPAPADEGEPRQGRVGWFRGGAEPNAFIDYEWPGPPGTVAFGATAGALGDINGDGFADLAAGAFEYTDGDPRTDLRVQVFLGGTTLQASAAFSIRDPGVERLLVGGIAALGDFDGDGWGDYAVGVPRRPGESAATGSVRIHFGWVEPGAEPFQRLDGRTAGETFGESVAGVGDLNGDGSVDLVVGASRNDTPADRAGAAYLFVGGSAASLIPYAMRRGAAADDRLGFSLAGGTDVNGDGLPDLLIGAPGVGEDETPVRTGRVELILGADGSEAVAAAWRTPLVYTGAAAADLFGFAVAGALVLR